MTLLVLRQRMRIADIWICPPDVSLKSDVTHSRYIPGDGMASMPPMAMGAISKNAGALVVAQGVRPRRNCVLPAPTQDAEVARLTRELASREAQEVT